MMRNYTSDEKKEFQQEFQFDWIPFRRSRHDPIDLAHEVIEYCKNKQIDTPLTAADVRAGIDNLPSWTNYPKDYLDFVFAVNAAMLNWWARLQEG